MAYVLRQMYTMITKAYEDNKDPRVAHLPLLQSPLPVIGIISAYLIVVLNYGPKWMEKRQPYELKNLMRIYNALQVLANGFLFYTGIQYSYARKDFSWTCQPVDSTNTEPWMMRLVLVSYGYYLTKYLDLFDTIFFVLRKKNNQITFLHVYHHAGMVAAVYVFMTFFPGSHSTMLGCINLLVHTVMYGYYFITSMRPVKKALWWKRHITELQLLQFGYLIFHFLLVIVRNPCNHPLIVSFVGLMQNLFMFILFFEFYRKAYGNKPKKAEEETSTAQSVKND